MDTGDGILVPYGDCEVSWSCEGRIPSRLWERPMPAIPFELCVGLLEDQAVASVWGWGGRKELH